VHSDKAGGPEVLFETCVAMKFVDNDDDDDGGGGGGGGGGALACYCKSSQFF